MPFVHEFSWTGAFGAIKDGLPFIGNYEKSRTVCLRCVGGNGNIFRLIAAEMLTDVITGKKNADQNYFSLAEFKRSY